MSDQRAVRVIGDGLAYTGPCLLTHVIMHPDAADDYADVYDGRDATMGKKFARIRSSSTNTRHVALGQGVRFDVGIYVDGYDAAVETTVVFVALAE